VKTTSIQLPGLIQSVSVVIDAHDGTLINDRIDRIALRRREVVHIGEGSNIWCHIHLQDLIRLYIQLIHHAFAQLKSNAKVDAYDNFYFAASGESVIKDLTEPLAALLYKKGMHI
jgi:nucleoside-diphosphate-sugar epimerase